MAKTIAINWLMRISENKKIPSETSLTKGKASLGNKNDLKLIKN